MKTLTIAVLYGGKSTEHEVSVHSAGDVCKELKKKHKILPVFITKKGEWFLQKTCGFKTKDDIQIFPISDGTLIDKKGKKYKADLFFPVLHGTFGEDGCVQGLFETLGVKYVGCKVLASALAMNKELSKEIAARVQIPILPWFSLNKNEKLDKKTILQNARKLGYPIFVKPNSLGSSIGITKVNKESELLPAIKKAFAFENYILVEKGLDLGNRSLFRVRSFLVAKDFLHLEEYLLELELSAFRVDGNVSKRGDTASEVENLAVAAVQRLHDRSAARLRQKLKQPVLTRHCQNFA